MKFPNKINNLLAEEIGLHIGDGSMNYYKNRGLYQLRGHIVDDKLHYQERIKVLYKEIFDINIKLRDMKSSGVFGFQIWSDELIDFKSKFLGLPLGKKTDFLIPNKIVVSEELSKKFLRGYFDTDGCLYIENKRGKPYPRVEFATISPKFAKQLQKVLQKLGFKYSIFVENRVKYGWKNLSKIRICGFKMTQKWFEEISPKNPKHVAKYRRLKSKNGSTEI